MKFYDCRADVVFVICMKLTVETDGENDSVVCVVDVLKECNWKYGKVSLNIFLKNNKFIHKPKPSIIKSISLYFLQV